MTEDFKSAKLARVRGAIQGLPHSPDARGVFVDFNAKKALISLADSDERETYDAYESALEKLGMFDEIESDSEVVPKGEDWVRVKLESLSFEDMVESLYLVP